VLDSRRETTPVDCDFDHIYGSFDAPLRRFVHSRIRDEAAAEDVVQEIYLRVHARLATLRDCRRLPGWIFQVARNAVIDHHRGRRPVEPLSDALPSPVDPGDDEVLRELALGLGPMIEALPPRYREALLLTLHEGLTQQQLAGRLGISLSGAKSRVQRARDRLKDLLLECCHFELDRQGRVVDFVERCCCCSREPHRPGGPAGAP
jgi:RNA polymerase sigma-70 factor, ECF subfamily